MLYFKCTQSREIFENFLVTVSYCGIVALTIFSCLFFWFHQRFFCGGRLILGPDVASIFLTTLLIAAPAIAFCIKVYYKIVDEGSVNARWYPVLVVGFILTVLVSISFSILASKRQNYYLLLHREARQLNEMCGIWWFLWLLYGIFLLLDMM